MKEVSTEKIELAARFVNSTASHIFLTGKAGTGKTTFLRNLAQATHKNFVIVAPTGIAALNAKGVTIHSQFLLPFGSYLPDTVNFQSAPQANFYTRRELARRHPINSDRKKVLRNIDLLIIDEVSMLRADVLDAIDYRLKSVKGNFKESFGGVQLLMIGDLYQLPPIVKDHEWEHLQRFYNSIHFFESRALKEDGFTYIELDKIFRQQDDKFINLLNNLRNDICTPKDLELLNSHHFDGKDEEEGSITITTHNYRADRINRDRLDKLDGPSKFYEAQIEDDFPEHIFPLPASLELREGAQVMFIKNDPEGQRYFNGKLAQVKKLTEDGICVSMEDADDFWLERHRWENLKYTVNNTTKELEEEVVGSFTQFPIRLAWAVTVHKSQGLTFDRAVIDVGQAFAPGQVYVALSRLRSLSGLKLRSRISDSVISSDAEVIKFSKQQAAKPELPQQLREKQKHYLYKLLDESFDFAPITGQIEYIQQKAGAKMEFEDEEMRTALERLRQAFLAEAANTAKFRGQLNRVLHQDKHELLLERIEKGGGYYLQFLGERLRELMIHIKEVGQLKRIKTYKNALEELDQLISWQVVQVQKVEGICRCIIQGKEVQIGEDVEKQKQELRKKITARAEEHIAANPKNLSTKTGRKRKPRSAKGETYQATFALIKEGLKPEEIAEKRGLVVGTIEGHLAKGITEEEVEIADFISAEEIAVMEKAFGGNPNHNLKDVFEGLEGKYSYGRLRMMKAHLMRGKQGE